LRVKGDPVTDLHVSPAQGVAADSVLESVGSTQGALPSEGNGPDSSRLIPPPPPPPCPAPS
jgi:hypothetical protein